MAKQTRGTMTKRIEKKSIELLGEAVCQTALRFMAYVQYTLMNTKQLKPEHMNSDDIMILDDWFKKGWLGTDDDNKLTCTKDFWDAMSELLYLGYVDLTKN